MYLFLKIGYNISIDCLNIILEKGFVSGIVESDETYFRVSYKGNHSKGTNFVLPRKPHKERWSKAR